MARDGSRSTPNGDEDTSELETTARRNSRASRHPRRSRTRALTSRNFSTGEMPAIEAEIIAPPVTPPVSSSKTVSLTSGAGATDTDDDAAPLEGELEDDRRTERARWIMVTSLLGITVLALTGVAIYLTDVVSQWEVRADELTEANYDLGDQIADAQDSISAQTEQIDLLTDQLSTAQERISELASQSANSDDDLAYAEQQIALLSSYASTGASVANALTRCIDGHDQLVVYLQNPDDYEEEEITAYAESVDELCDAARSSNTEFQKLINE